MKSQNSKTPGQKTANQQSTFKSFAIATFAIALTAAAVSTTVSTSATARSADYRTYGFNSQKDMDTYFTIQSAEVHEIPTNASIMRQVADVTINVGPVQIGGGNTATTGAPTGQATGGAQSGTQNAPTRPSLSIPGLPQAAPAPGASASPAPTSSATPAPTATPSKPPISVQVPGVPGAGMPIGGITPGDIMPWIALGEKIWALIEANKPVVNVQTKRASILPVAEQDWTQMENWKGPSAHTYRLEYRNGFGSTVIAHTYTIAYNYGGTYNEQGQFLANVTVIPSRVDVAWGYTLNTSVELGEAVNTGSKASPVPGIEVQIISKVDTVLKHAETRDGFFVKGSGEIQQLTNPNATLVP